MTPKQPRLNPKKKKNRSSGGEAPPPAPRAKGLLIGAAPIVLVALGAIVYFALARSSPEAPPLRPLQTPLITSNSAVTAPVAVSTNSPGEPPTAAAAPINTNDPNALVEIMTRANQLLAKGQASNAVQLLRQAEHLTPDDEDVRYNLGIALARMGKTDEAVREYQEAIRLLPDYAEAHNNLGNLLLRQGKRDEAIKHFEEAVRITPDYAVAWNSLGTALQQSGRTNEALANFQKAAQLDTNFWQARFNLGTSLLHEKKLDAARAEFEAVQRLEPTFKPAAVALEKLRHEQAEAARP